MSMLYRFDIKNGDLFISSATNGEVIWTGKPKGYDVTQVLPIVGSNDCIVLLDWLKTGLENQKNLLRLDSHGFTVWEVGDPPKGFVYGIERGVETESYTGITGIDKIQVTAFSYSCFSDQIELGSGNIIKSEFVK